MHTQPQSYQAPEQTHMRIENRRIEAGKGGTNLLLIIASRVDTLSINLPTLYSLLFTTNITILMSAPQHRQLRRAAHITKIASIDLCSLEEEDHEDLVLEESGHHPSDIQNEKPNRPPYSTLIRKRSGKVFRFVRPKLADLWHSRYHEASFDLGRRLGIGRRTQSCCEDVCDEEVNIICSIDNIYACITSCYLHR